MIYTPKQSNVEIVQVSEGIFSVNLNGTLPSYRYSLLLNNEGLVELEDFTLYEATQFILKSLISF